MMQSLRNDALDYAARGWSVVPLHAPVKGRCTCGRTDCDKIGKHPHTDHGAKDATTDAGIIQLWFDLWDNANVGIATGERSGFFTLDIDPRSGGDDSFADLKAKYGPFPETVETVTGGGGAQIWFAQPSFTVPSTKLGPGIDVIGEGKTTVAPYSLHKSGRRYEFEASSHPDRVQIAQAPELLLRDLQARARKDTPHGAHVVTATGTPRLALAILRGTSSRQYDSRSEQEQAAITSLVNAGWHFDDVLDLFEREAHAKTHFAELQRKPREAARWLKLSYENAVEFVRTHESAGIKIARERRTWALSFDWPGRTRATDQAVTFAHCEIVERCGRDTYQAGSRELGERAGISRRAAERANKRLTHLQVIECVKPFDKKKPTHPAVWKLKRGGATVPTHSRSYALVSGYNTTPPIAHDLFRTRRSRTRKMLGLGKIGARVWQFMQDLQPHSLKEIARQVKHDRKAIRKILGKMLAAEMVRKIGEQWQVVEGADLDRAAGVLGMAGTAQHQRDRHQAERNHRRAELKAGRGAA